MSKKPIAEVRAKKIRDAVPAIKESLHPRNKHRGRYDFPQLVACSPELAPFVAPNAYGDASIDFANPEAVRALNRALLKCMYGITSWDLPPQYLCPPIPGRADYLHYVADLLATDGVVPQGESIRVLDIGVGANCIYPLIGHREYGWHFVGTDIDRAVLACAQANIDANAGFGDAVELRYQSARSAIFKNVLRQDELFDLVICNPPFHASLEEARAGSERKWQNLGKAAAGAKSPVLNFGGHWAELCCLGGEEGFISRMVAESAQIRNCCLWFTTLVSRSTSLPAVYRALKEADVQNSRTIEMAQGQKKSRIVAWTFFNRRQHDAWRKQRGSA